MKRFISIAGGLITSAFSAFAQTEISTDRPDQTETSHTVPLHAFQFETGFYYQTLNDEELYFNSTLLRYGLFKFLELRLETNLHHEPEMSDPAVEFCSPAPGFKVSLFQQKGIIPETAIIGDIALNSVSTDRCQSSTIDPALSLSMSNEIDSTFSLGYNLGIERSGVEDSYGAFYTLSLAIGLSNRVGTFVETFGDVDADWNASINFDCGVTYLINRLMQVDLSLGVGQNGYRFIGAGFSFATK